MKILIGHNRYFISGGDDRVTWETAELLKKKGHQVIPFTMENKNNWKSEYSGYFVKEIDYSKIRPTFSALKTAIKMVYSFESRRKIEELIKSTKPDIAHLHNIYGRLTPAILHSLKKYKIPTVMTLHDYKLICPGYSMVNHGKICEKCKGGKYYKSIVTKCHKDSYLASFLYCVETYFHKLLKSYEKNINFFITPSIFMQKKMIEFGMPKEKIKYIPNFIDAKAYAPLSSHKNHILYFGKLLRAKGILTLLKAVEGLNNSSLFIAGDGDFRGELKKFTLEHNISDVHFLGYIQGEKMLKILAKSKFVVLPSECYENAPMAVLEAFAYGKAVVGARIGGIPELITHGKDGLLFESGNVEDLKQKICQMFDKTDEELKIMGKTGREKVSRYFNAESYYERISSLYKNALNSKWRR